MNKSHKYVDQNHRPLCDDDVLLMNLIDEVEMVNVEYCLYERQVILNLLLNYDCVTVKLVNEVTEVLDCGLKK
jgi:hypothetical protein